MNGTYVLIERPIIKWKLRADTGRGTDYFTQMSFNEVLAELPGLSISERQLLVRRALELDDSMPTVEDETLIAQRLADHNQNPGSAIPLDEMKSRLRERFAQ